MISFRQFLGEGIKETPIPVVRDRYRALLRLIDETIPIQEDRERFKRRLQIIDDTGTNS